MDPKTKQLVEDAEARAEKATKGPWIDTRYHDDELCSHVASTAGDGEREVAFCALGVVEHDHNGRFIARARTDVPALCSAVREQDKRARHAEEERDAFDKRIVEMEAQCENIELEHAASWFAFEREALDAIGPEVIGTTVDAGADIPGMIKKLHERYRVEIQRERSRRIEAEEQLTTYKRIANIKRKK